MATNDRNPVVKRPNPHSLKAKTKGANRFQPGSYLCYCGAEFTSIKVFEAHRAEANRQERKAG